MTSKKRSLVLEIADVVADDAASPAGRLGAFLRGKPMQSCRSRRFAARQQLTNLAGLLRITRHPKALSAALSSPEHAVKPQILRNQLVGNERHFLCIDRAEEIVDLCDSDELAHAAARQRGGVFVKLPPDGAPASDLAVLELVVQVWRANGDVGKAVDDTLADGRVEAQEIAEVRRAIYRAQQAMVAMLSRLEGMTG